MNDAQNYDLRIFYFENFEKRDAELVELREEAYNGDIERMLKIYEERLTNPDMNPINVSDDVERLRHIRELEANLIKTSVSLEGIQLRSMLPLVKKYEPERKKNNGLAEKVNNANPQQPLKT